MHMWMEVHVGPRGHVHMRVRVQMCVHMRVRSHARLGVCARERIAVLSAHTTGTATHTLNNARAHTAGTGDMPGVGPTAALWQRRVPGDTATLWQRTRGVSGPHGGSVAGGHVGFQGTRQPSVPAGGWPGRERAGGCNTPLPSIG